MDKLQFQTGKTTFNLAQHLFGFIMISVLLGISLGALGQTKTLKCPGEYTFSVNYTFNEVSKRIGPSDLEITERNDRGQKTRFYHVYPPNKLSTKYCNDYDNDGRLLARYTIGTNGDTSYSEQNQYNADGELIRSITHAGMTTYEYNHDSSYVLLFTHRTNIRKLSEKRYLNENGQPYRVLKYSGLNILYETETINYLENDILEVIMSNNVSDAIYKDYIQTKPSHTLYLRLKISSDGNIDTLINRIPKTLIKKAVTSDEYAHYNYGSHPPYDIDTFSNGLTSRITFHSRMM